MPTLGWVSWEPCYTARHMNISTGIAVALAVIVALSFMFLGSWVFAPFESAPAEAFPTETQANQGTLMVTDEVEGTGAEAVAGMTVTVNYVGRLEDGTIFDASANHGGTFSFTLGAGEVIAGWDQGILGMKVGGKRHLTIPPELGYGARPVGPIPANSTLLFEVDLVSVQ